MEVILNINNLKYSYNDENIIFNNLCMYIQKSSITAISGPNNSGKTTLLKLLSTNKYNKKGTIILDAKDIVEYSKQEYNKQVQAVFYNEQFKESKVIDELYISQEEIDEEKTNFIIEELSITKVLNKDLNTLSKQDKYKVLIGKAILNSNNLILLDSLDEYFNSNEISDLYKFFRKCIEKYDLTFIITINNLVNSLEVDNLFIINQGSTMLYGEPITVLSKDNIINKAGLDIPFMIDLSVKLKDYNLLNKIELDKERLIDTLWK